MGEMIKFGIKLALTISTALALIAALAILFSTISSVIPSISGSAFLVLREIFQLFCLVVPINFEAFFAMLGSLFAFKVAYWASDKMLWLIDVLG